MADTSLVDEIKYPIKDCDLESCLEAHKRADGGTFPIGKKNSTWHSGLHFATEKPIVAIADGEVVAYRFTQKTLEAKLQSVLYSDSFVLLRHYYKSTFGNILDFFSLYMHLDPVPVRQFLPKFLAFRGNIAKGKEFPAPGLMMYKSDDYKESLFLVPKYSVVSLTGEPINADGATYQPVSVATIDGVTLTGVFKNASSYLKTEDDKTYIEKAPHTHVYGTNNKVWNCCKNLKGIRIRAEAKNNGDIIGFIPNGQIIDFEAIAGNSQWAKLKSPLPDSLKNENCFIKVHGQVSIETTGQPDQSLLGTLQIPENNKRPQIQAGDVLGGPGPYIHPSDKKIVHIEIFTLQDLNTGNGILGDTKGERYFSSIARYVIPSGQPLAPLPLDNIALSINDSARIVEEPAGSQFVKIQVTGVFRTVKYLWLDDPNQKVFCDELNTSTWYYKIKQRYLDDFKKIFNGWIEQTSILYRVSSADKKRGVFFPCASINAAQVWIAKSAIGEKDDAGNVKITQETNLLYSENPDSIAGQVSNQEITIDNQEVITLNDKRYIRKDNATLVDITGIEPQTPFNWGGFELLCEDPPNYDAFMDFANVKSKFIAGKDDIKETETGKELNEAIKTGADTYDISKIYDDPSWKDRLQKLIVRVPCEWHYSDEKYTSLSDKIGNLDPDEIKKLIKSLAFWDDCKSKGVFDEKTDAPPFPATAKDGKEIWCFHPIAFLHQMAALLKAELPPNQKLNFDTFMGLILAAAGDQYTNGECCKAIAASLSYRLKKQEWAEAYDFHSLAERHKLKVLPPADDEFAEMIAHVAQIFLDKKWGGLPEGYVLFHLSSQSLSSMPWDSSVLDTANVKTIGNFTFYKYKAGAKSFATKLSIKEIKLISGGDKGESLPCQADGVVSVSSDGSVKPYRYDVRVKPEWEFEFSFNIENGTVEMERLKPAVKWELNYFTKRDGKGEEVKKVLNRTGNRFKVRIDSEVSDYSVRLQPLDNNNTKLCDEFTIAIKKKEQMVFNGTVLKWLDENGDAVPFQDGIRLISEIPAYSGNADKRSKEFTGVFNAGPIPEGVWWVAKNNVENSLSIRLGQIAASQWPGNDARWGKHRVWLEPDSMTNHKGRERLSICGGNLENGGGDIHLKDLCTVFINNFTSRVMDGGRVMLNVDYSNQVIVEDCYIIINTNSIIRNEPPTFEKTTSIIPYFDHVKVLQESGNMVEVSKMDGTRIGWTEKKNVHHFYKNVEKFQSEPLELKTPKVIDNSWPRVKKILGKTYNRLGGLINKFASELDFSPAAVLAVWYVESAGREHTPNKAIIRFENHLFYDKWGKNNEKEFNKYFQFGSNNGVSGNRWENHTFRKNESDSFKSFHGDQNAEYEVLNFARKIDDVAGLNSISIGGSQILVNNHFGIGYKTSQEMYNSFQNDERSHVLGFIDFCDRSGLLKHIKSKSWTAFAAGYNGQGKAAEYGNHISNAFNLASELM